VNTTEHNLHNYFDIDNNVEYVNLLPFLKHSYNEYNMFVVDNELIKLSSKEKNQLSIHFILKQILFVCKMSNHKKCFYYQSDTGNDPEHTLVKRIFNTLPSRIIYNSMSFDEFIVDQREYQTYFPIDTSKISWKKFKSFLKSNNLTQIEKDFITDINVKLSLLH
tara:strand:- start:134 stop:625 length:492 start_codon:yes stop_codon:yes gene_type:complete